MVNVSPFAHFSSSSRFKLLGSCAPGHIGLHCLDNFKLWLRANVCSAEAGKEKPTSKQAWIRKRKAAVDQAAQEEELCTPPKRPSLELPESLAKEQSKQRALQMKRKAEAYLEGTLVAKEATQEVKDAAEMKQKIDGGNDRDRARKFADASAKLAVRQNKQDVTWARKKLPQPATLLDVAPGMVLATKQKLKQAGVATFVQDRN